MVATAGGGDGGVAAWRATPPLLLLPPLSWEADVAAATAAATVRCHCGDDDTAAATRCHSGGGGVSCDLPPLLGGVACGGIDGVPSSSGGGDGTPRRSTKVAGVR